jgi:hypothetical protein
MKLSCKRRFFGTTLVETAVALGIGTAILAALTTASVALQRSFVAIEDYSKGMNDQMRISDYLALDMRRAFSVNLSGSCQSPPLTVTLTIPNFYVPTGDVPNDPKITSVTGWPYKKHHHNKHQNIILNQVIDYAPASSPSDTVLTVVYVFDNGAQTLSRSVYLGSFIPPATPPANKLIGTPSVIATDVKDFCVTISDLDETATTQITFQPRFRTVASASAIAATTYFQTTLTRNTR